MSKPDTKQKPLLSAEGMNYTTRKENMDDFSPEWCQKLLDDPAYQNVNHSTRYIGGPFGESFNSLLGRTLFTDQTIRAMKCLYKPGEMLALLSLGSDMCSHPGVLHGGINTVIVDEVTGRLAFLEASGPLMAVNFNVNLRMSVKAPGLILVKAWIERPPEGRKYWVRCRIEQEGVTCIEAEGLYVKMDNMYKLSHCYLQIVGLRNQLNNFITTNATTTRLPFTTGPHGFASSSDGLDRAMGPSKPDRMSALPAELMTKILKQLSTREICRVRTLSRHFKALVDTNQNDILRFLIAINKARIKADHSTLHCRKVTDFQSVFKGFLDYYGRIGNDLARTDVADRFFTQYVRRLYRHVHPSNGLALRTGLTMILKIVTEPEFFIQNNLDPFKYALVFDTPASRIGDKSLLHCLSSIMPIGLPKTSRCYEKKSFPRFFLTQYNPTTCVPPSIRNGWCIAVSGNLLSSLGLPSERPNSRFAYCVKSDKLWSIANQVWQKQGKKLSLFEQATLLDDIFIW